MVVHYLEGEKKHRRKTAGEAKFEIKKASLESKMPLLHSKLQTPEMALY